MIEGTRPTNKLEWNKILKNFQTVKSRVAARTTAGVASADVGKDFFTSNYVLLVLFLAPVVTDFYQQTSKIRAQINQIFLAR